MTSIVTVKKSSAAVVRACVEYESVGHKNFRRFRLNTNCRFCRKLSVYLPMNRLLFRNSVKTYSHSVYFVSTLYVMLQQVVWMAWTVCVRFLPT